MNILNKYFLLSLVYYLRMTPLKIALDRGHLVRRTADGTSAFHSHRIFIQPLVNAS